MGRSSKVKEEPTEGESTMDLDSSQANGSNKSQLLEPSAEKEEYENLCEFVNAIAHPVAPRKLAKKLYKLIKKSSKQKHHLRQGIVDVQRALRKGEVGLVVLAGNVTPIEIYCHIPAVCEEKEVPYVFTPSREHLGLAAGHRRATIVMLVRPHESYNELLDECKEWSHKLPIPT